MPFANNVVPPDYEDWMALDRVYQECRSNLNVVNDIADILVSEPVRKLGNKLDHGKLRPMIQQLAKDANRQRAALDTIYGRRPTNLDAHRGEFESFDLSMNIGQALMAWTDDTNNCVNTVVADIMLMINQHLPDADRITIDLKEISLG